MRNVLALVGLGGVLFLGAGYYKGWFTLENDSGKLNIEVNTDKAKKDIEAGIEKGMAKIKEHSDEKSK